MNNARQAPVAYGLLPFCEREARSDPMFSSARHAVACMFVSLEDMVAGVPVHIIWLTWMKLS